MRCALDNPDMDSDIKHAVDSIPAYVDAADLFVVLCPSLQHSDTQEVCDQVTRSRRGWCRVELAAAVLGRKPDKRLLVIKSATSFSLMLANDSLHPPGTGEFTEASDQIAVFPVTESIVNTHLRLMWAQGERELVRSRVLTAKRASMLFGLGDMVQRQQTQRGEIDPEVFQQRFRINSLTDPDPTGVGPVVCAALAGNIPMLRHLAAARADINERITALGERSDLLLISGSTPLMVASVHGVDPEVLRCLLELRADSTARNRVGAMALHSAVAAGNCASIELLLSIGLDIEAVAKPGNRPIHNTALGGHTDALQLLLDRRAFVDPPMGLGPTPLIFSAFQGHTACCRLLLEYRADVNHVARPWGSGLIISSILWLASPWIAETGPFRHLVILDGGTALQAAAMMGHQEVVKLLLGARADPAVRHRTGVDAKELARRGQHTALEELLSLTWRTDDSFDDVFSF